MAQKINVFDGETVVDTARVEVLIIGRGAIVTTTLVNDEGTAIIASSTIFRSWDPEMVMSAGSQMISQLQARVAETVTGVEADVAV